MKERIFLVVFTVLILFTVNSQIHGQSNEQIDISKYLDKDGIPFLSDFAEERQTDKMIFEIGKDSSVRAIHVVVGDVWSPDSPKLIKMLPGGHSNPQLTDEDGDYLRPLGWTAETFEEAEYMIAGQKAYRNYDLHASYDLENFLELSDSGLWTKHFEFPHDVEIYIDEDVELVFVNSRPVDISEANGVNCIGCDMTLEFFDKSDVITKVVINNETKFQELSNTGEEFVIEFMTNGEIGNVTFFEELNYLSFNSEKEDQLVTLKIPLELLLFPYHVYVTEYDQEILSESDKVRNNEYGLTDTHANLAFRTSTEGVVHVVGSTQMEHEKFVERIEQREIVSKSETDAQAGVKVSEEKSETNQGLYESWETQNSNEDSTTMIFIIIGIVIAIIIGVIIKLKKN